MSTETAPAFAGIVMTAAAVGLNFLAMGPVVMLLNLGLIAALFAWLANGAGCRTPHRMLGPLYLSTIPMLMLHGVEEYSGRLYETLPPRFGLKPIQPGHFAAFNLVWLMIFLVAAIGVFRGVRLSLLVVWFVALLGCIGNAVFHGWLALQSGGYEAGVVTAMLNLPLGVMLVILLVGESRVRE